MPQKAVLITGCSSGIGFALLEPLLERGHLVFATLRNLDSRRELFRPLEAKAAGRLHFSELDVTKAADRERALETVARTAGRLDVLVNNAGFGIFGPLEETSEAMVREQLETNFFGPVLLTQAALPMLRAGKGRVITISSILGEVGAPFTSLYSASKFALEGLFESLAHETRSLGVRSVLVLPGGHRTRFFENRRRLLRDGSPYAREAETVLRVMSSGSGKASVDAVVRAVLPLVDRRLIPLRTYVGLDAKAIHCLHSLLPQFIFQPLLRTGISLASRRK